MQHRIIFPVGYKSFQKMYDGVTRIKFDDPGITLTGLIKLKVINVINV
jgi:hypothetical protein